MTQSYDSFMNEHTITKSEPTPKDESISKYDDRAKSVLAQIHARNDMNAFHGIDRPGTRRLLGSSTGFCGNNFFDDDPHHFHLHNLEHLQRVSRRESIKSPEASSIFSTLRLNVINTGLTLEASPLFDILGIEDQEMQKKWTQKVEGLWKLWTDSVTADIREINTINQIQKQTFKGQIRDGEYFILLRYSNSQRLMNSLQVQTISPLNVATPFLDKKLISGINERGNRIDNGIEYDKFDREIAFFILDCNTARHVRVPKFGPRLGRRFVIHGFIKEYPKQSRGFPILAGLLPELQKISKYTIAELHAAVVNASIAAIVKPSPNAASSQPFAAVQLREDPINELESELIADPINTGFFSEPGLIMQNLKAGEDFTSFDTKRPNVNYGEFVKSIKSGLSASLGIPIEVLTMMFNSNFSASRASLMMFWNTVRDWQSEFSSHFLNPLYEMWLQDLVQRRQIEAPGFLNNPTLRAAWLNSRWIGIPKPSIDPVKEAKAANQRIIDGLTTRETESRQHNGSSFEENVTRLSQENESLSIANNNLNPKEFDLEIDTEEEKKEDADSA